MMSQVVKVRREKIAACMTCPICNKLLREATTISECLHTFCRKCILEKITEEDLDSCPVCNTNLGCAPLDKLRADHSLQDLRAKIFPSKKTKAKAVEAAPSVPLPTPTRRKERSLSSLAVNTPKIPAQTGATGKRTKSAARKVLASRELDFPVEEPIKPVEDPAGCSSSPETINKIAQNIVKEVKNLSIAELSKQHMPSIGKDSLEPCEGEADMWEPIKCPVEASSKTQISLMGSVVQLATSHVHDDEAYVPKDKVKESNDNLKVHAYENGSTPVPSRVVKPRKSKGVRQKRAAPSEMLNSQAQAVVDASSECEQGVSSIWFSLVASSQEKGVSPLPQIPSRYLRIKDGSITVSYIKKYLVKKLDLISEAEVEITLRGQPLPSTWQLNELIDLWLHTAPTSQRIQTTVGSSAKDVVMVLLYGRKVQFP